MRILISRAGLSRLAAFILFCGLLLLIHLSGCAGLLVVPGSGDTTTTIGTTTTTSTLGSTTTLPNYSATLIYKKTGQGTSDQFGRAVSSAGDINGDGKADFMVGMTKHSSPGYLLIYSGADGSLLASQEGSLSDGSFGFAIAAGDLDADKKTDLIASDPAAAYIRLIYANDISEGLNLTLPATSLAYLGDINGDGHGDFIFGDHEYSPAGLFGAGRAEVISGKEKLVVQLKEGDVTDMQFGRAVDAAGDVNGDGTTDYLVGAPNASPSGKASAGSAFVFSGADGSLLFRKDGAATGDQFGCSVAGLGDLNSDGCSEFAVGAHLTDPSGKTNAGSVSVFSGSDGNIFYRLDGDATRIEFGTTLAKIGDLTDDGKNDFAVGAPLASPNNKEEAGSVYLYCGYSGNLICRLDGEGGKVLLGKNGDHFGLDVAAAGDINGDGKPEIIVGACEYAAIGTTYVGAAYVYSIDKE